VVESWRCSCNHAYNHSHHDKSGKVGPGEVEGGRARKK